MQVLNRFYMKKTIVLILVIATFVSCSQQQKNKNINSFKKTLDANLGKKLFVPDSLELYNPFPNSTDNQASLNPKLIIYSHIDASCDTCIETLSLWNSIIPEFSKEDVKVVIICSSDNRFELLKYYFESGEITNFSYPLYLDYKDDFIFNNTFMSESKNFETVLTDNHNNILLIGNPNFTKKIKELYFKIIKKHNK